MGKYPPGHYNTGIDTAVSQGSGEAVVLTARGPNNEYVEAVVREKYNELGEKTIEAIESLRTNIRDSDNLDSAIEALELAISISPGYSWMAEPLADITRNTVSLIKNRQSRIDQIVDEAVSGNESSSFGRAKTWTLPRDPILLDLDGNGLETVGLAANVYFDHNGDDVLTRTGWVGPNDVLLVWDRNANGTIDTGAELFGDFTPLPNGTLAPNGFAALAALDENGDGIIDASDPAFADLKLWKDADQNGQTGAGELIALAEAGIVSLSLANTVKNQSLSNGNKLTREGHFTRADGSTAAMGEFQFATDTFNTRFAEQIDVPEALQGLPTLQGSGAVRELQQAATLSDSLAGMVAQFQSATTRAEQRALLDPLIAAWAASSGMDSLEQRAGGQYRIQYDAFGNVSRSTNIDGVAFAAASTGSVGNVLMTDAEGPYLTERYRTLIADWGRKLHVLEAFNGQYFFNLPTQKSQTSGANWGLTLAAGSSNSGSGSGAVAIGALPTLRVSFAQAQLDLLQQAYDSLAESVYASLVLQTRLKPYLDRIELVFDEQGLRLDAASLNEMLADKRAVDPENYLADLLDLDKYASGFLSGTNWMGLADFDSFIETLRFKEGVAPADVRLIRSGNDLVLAIRNNGGSSDQVTLKQYFDEAWNGANGPYLIERIAFADGTVLSFADVQSTLFAGSEEAAANKSRRWPDGGAANTTWRVAA